MDRSTLLRDHQEWANSHPVAARRQRAIRKSRWERALRKLKPWRRRRDY